MKTKNCFLCQSCGYSSPKWMGRCPDCGGWNTLVEEKIKAVIAQNISSGGLLLLLPEFQPVSTCLKVRLYLGIRAIDAGVKVAWTEILTGREKNEFRCGVCFTDIMEQDLEFIREFIIEYMERERE